MADENSIIINIKAQSDVDEATRQVAEMLKAARDLAAQSGKLQQSNGSLSQSFQQTAGAAGKSIDALNKATRQENMLAGATQSMRTELRKVSDELRALAESGDTTSDKFLLLADRAASMTDTMGDVQSIVRILASDTKKLDTAMAVGGGLVGTFNAATSAIALLGGESEELNQAFLKVQAALSILNGLQQVSLVLDKRSAANVVLRTAYTKLMAKANVEAAASQSLLNKAMMANPVGMVMAAVAALAAAFVVLKDRIEPVKNAMEKLSGWFNRSKIEAQAAADAADAQAAALERVENAARSLANLDTGSSMADLQKELQNAITMYDAYVAGAKREGKEVAAFYDELINAQKNAKEYLEKGDIANALSWQSQFQRMLDSMDANERAYYAMIEGAQAKIDSLKKQQEDDAKRAQEEREEELNKELRESFKARSDAEREAAEEEYRIWKYYRDKRSADVKAEQDRQKYNSDLAQQEAEDEMAYSDEVAEHDMENWEKIKQKRIESYQEAMRVAQESVQYMADLTNEIFGIISNNIDAQLESLRNMYTTDAKEARDNAQKKFITEEEFEKKKAALTLKQQKLNKASSIFQIGIQTAMAIMNALATAPWPLNVVQATLAGTIGAAQLAAASAKPLPQYAKGRKGGEGEYAMVGERGAEIMYIPAGASIIPHNKINDPASWGAYGVPSISMPDLPNTDNLVTTLAMMSASGQIDYDRMGAAIAKHMPSQKAVSINVDRNGVRVSDGHDTHTYLNTKYSGAWF